MSNNIKMHCGKLNELTARILRVYIDVKISMQYSGMYSAGIKKIFFKFRILLVQFFIKDGVFYEVV